MTTVVPIDDLKGKIEEEYRVKNTFISKYIQIQNHSLLIQT